MLEAEQTAWLAKQGIGATDDTAKYTAVPTSRSKESSSVTATVQAIYTQSGFVTEIATAVADADASEEHEQHESVGIVLDATCFYAESGALHYLASLFAAFDCAGVCSMQCSMQ